MLGYDQVYEYDKRFGRLTTNFCVDVFAHGRECLESAISIAFTKRTTWGHKYLEATHYLIDPTYGLVLFEQAPRDAWDPDGMRVNGSKELTPALKGSEITDFVWKWLSQVEYPPSYENDGTGIEGWRVYNEEDGVVGGCPDAVVAIKPFWVYLGK